MEEIKVFICCTDRCRQREIQRRLGDSFLTKRVGNILHFSWGVIHYVLAASLPDSVRGLRLTGYNDCGKPYMLNKDTKLFLKSRVS